MTGSRSHSWTGSETRVVLLIDDDEAVLRSIGRYLEHLNYRVVREAEGAQAVARFHEHRPMAVVLDLHLPDVSGFGLLDELVSEGATVILLTGHGDIPTAVEAVQRGAHNFLTKPVDMLHLAGAVERACERSALQREVAVLRTQHDSPEDVFASGNSRTMRELMQHVDLLAENDPTSVLITGERGTGKSHIAREIHRRSPRAEGPFIKVSCHNTDLTRFETDLFGVEGRREEDANRQGLVELANGGSLYLDDVGELAAEVQPKILHILETRAARRVNGTREVPLDVRILASTDRDLSVEVEEGRFRENLLYRLNVLPIRVPSLREREPSDRRDLLNALLAVLGVERGEPTREIESQAVERLLEYPWPGNVREMRNVLERAMILAGARSKVRLAHLPIEVRGGRRAADGRRQVMTLGEVERRHIERTLQFRDGNRTHTARELGISRATLIKKIKLYGLEDGGGND